MTEPLQDKCGGISIKEICNQRYNSIIELEESFQKSPNIGTAITLRDIWENWRDYPWSHEGISSEEVGKRINFYRNYVEENQ